MSAVVPAPDSLPSLIAPAANEELQESPPSDLTATTSPPPTSQPNQTTESPPASTPSIPSAPPPQSPPPAVPAVATPPSPPQSPPQQPPPLSPPLSPPPSTPSTTPPPTSPPPSPPASPPPSPPTQPLPSPPAVTSPPPEETSPPPPLVVSPPPQTAPSPPSPTQPPPRAIPPPPASNRPPLSSNPPPPRVTEPPRTSPSPPVLTPPPTTSQSAPPPVKSLNSPPEPASSPPSASIPLPSSPPAVSPPAPPSNIPSTPGSPSGSPLPAIPREKPTAKPTGDGDVAANTSSNSGRSLGTGGAVAIGIVVGFVVLSLLVMAVWFVRKRKKKGAAPKFGNTMPSPFASSQNSDSAFLRPYSPTPLVESHPNSGSIYSPSESSGLSNSKPWFTYDELVKATHGFSEYNILGEGGFGCVYKGLLTDGREVAVKQLKIGGGQGEREFRAEVEIISRVHHRHLVSLVGYCISEHQRLLIYDYVPNNTLHYHLHAVGSSDMDWATRVKVAAGAARGIAYLHEDCHPRIIHRDIKSSNILLDNNFEARVSDFGLAKLALELDSQTHVTTRVMGTFGYMAPEYATSGKLTEKSDVYSFGVVLLELITGRKPVDSSQPVGDESLVEWARPLLTEALERENFEVLADPRLGTNYVGTEMFRMIEAAAACVRHSAAKRPKMSQVVRALDSLDEFSDLTNGMKPGQSEIYNSSEHSAQIRMFQRLAFGNQDYSSSFFDQSQSSWRSRDSGDRSSLMP